MNVLLVRVAMWLLRVAGGSPAAERVVLLHSIRDIAEAEGRLARARLRLEALDARGANIARDGPGDGGRR